MDLNSLIEEKVDDEENGENEVTLPTCYCFNCKRM